MTRSPAATPLPPASPDLPATLEPLASTPQELRRAELSGRLLRGADLSGRVANDLRIVESRLGASFVRSELGGCRLEAVGNRERLRGVRMPMADVVQAADVIAAAAGIQIVE